MFDIDDAMQVVYYKKNSSTGCKFLIMCDFGLVRSFRIPSFQRSPSINIKHQLKFRQHHYLIRPPTTHCDGCEYQSSLTYFLLALAFGPQLDSGFSGKRASLRSREGGLASFLMSKQACSLDTRVWRILQVRQDKMPKCK